MYGKAHPVVLSRHRASDQWLIEIKGFWEAFTTARELRTFARAVLRVLDEGQGCQEGSFGYNPHSFMPAAEFSVGFDKGVPYLLVAIFDGTCGSPHLIQDPADSARLRAGVGALLAVLDSAVRQ